MDITVASLLPPRVRVQTRNGVRVSVKQPLAGAQDSEDFRAKLAFCLLKAKTCGTGNARRVGTCTLRRLQVKTHVQVTL